MKFANLLLLVGVLAASSTFAVAQAPSPPAKPAAVVFDTSVPGRVTLSYMTDSKIDAAALSYDFKSLGKNLSWSAIFLQSTDGADRTFLGTALMYRAYHTDVADIVLGLGVKGFEPGASKLGDIKFKRDVVFGFGVQFRYKPAA